jgi:hypothetical protein
MIIGYAVMNYRLILIIFFIVICSGVSGFANAEPPSYGHLWGVVLSEGGNSHALGNAVVYVVSSEQKYYSFSSSNGDFDMQLPVGHYSVYGQYKDGTLYQSSKSVSVDVRGATTKNGNDPLQLYISLAGPASNPLPTDIPGTFMNKVNGTVSYKDGTGVPGATVSLWQSSDDNPNDFLKEAETIANNNGYYQFNDVKVTTNPPNNDVIFGMKTFRVSSTYTDSQGNTHVMNKSFPLYNPNIILGIGGTEMTARNMTANLQIDYTNNGWIKIQCDPNGASVFVDNQPLLGSDGNQLVTPCTGYIASGRHTVRLTMEGYAPSEYLVNMVANQQTQDLISHLDKPLVPANTQAPADTQASGNITISGGVFLLLIAAIIILLIVMGILLVLVITILIKKTK